jgi:uncharacterized RDD family membrane protein YckC
MEPISDQPPGPVDFDLAKPGARLGARFIDVFIGFSVFLITLVVVVMSYDVELTDDPDTLTIPDSGALILRWVPILIWGVYEVLLVARNGQTLGKMVTKIKVISAQGADAVPTKAAGVRWLVLAIPPVLIPDLLFGLGISFLVGMWFVIDANRQGLHDKAAGTYVVRVGPAVVE